MKTLEIRVVEMSHKAESEAPRAAEGALSLILEHAPTTQQPTAPLRVGDLCPVCQKGRLDYDGLLNLTCPECGHSGDMGCFS